MNVCGLFVFDRRIHVVEYGYSNLRCFLSESLEVKLMLQYYTEHIRLLYTKHTKLSDLHEVYSV